MVVKPEQVAAETLPLHARTFQRYCRPAANVCVTLVPPVVVSTTSGGLEGLAVTSEIP